MAGSWSSVLLSEMELARSEKKPDKLPYLGHPYFLRESEADGSTDRAD